MSKPTILERFEDSYTPEPMSGCWLWIKAVNGTGYGTIRVNNRTRGAHRVGYELLRGAIPLGLHLDHLCRVRLCVNPFHLEAVTPTENKLRGIGPTAVNSRATHCKYGHPLSGDNLFRRVNGRRQCRLCQRITGTINKRRRTARRRQFESQR